MSVAVIRALHGAPSLARVSQSRYAPNSAFRASSRPGWLYVLDGVLVFAAAGVEVQLSAGDVLVVDGGTYELRVGPDSEATIVMAWLLPDEFHGPDTGMRS